jgi:hypothetical protein
MPKSKSKRFDSSPRSAAICLAAVLAVVAPFGISSYAADTQASAPTPDVSLDEVLVTGERPGPGMWRVAKGDHELWILATLEPLPKKMKWRSAAVEDRIALSQAVLAPPNVDADVGFFRGITLLPSLLRARHSPDGQTLEQTLPHDLYIRWLALRVKYLGSGGGDETLRPLLAALDLYLHAIDAVGLTSDDGVWDVVEQTAHKHRVPVLPVTFKLPLDDPKGAIRELGSIPRDAEVACLASTVQRLETDLPPMRERANLWSLGDVRGLRAMTYPDESMTCLNAFFAVPALREPMQQARAKLFDLWLAAADAALDKNLSSFAVLPINELLEPQGLLARLQAKGYVIVEPEAHEEPAP